jgi:ABC-type molybdenum transport system, ATPase component/photorepair protein PhrA
MNDSDSGESALIGAARAAAVPAIDIRDATVIRGGREVLKELSLRLGQDEQACILGPNGSGKSTLVRMIAGELSPLYREPSAIRLFGEERWNLFDLRSRLGLVSEGLQTQQARDESVLDTILSGFYGSVGLPLHCEPPPKFLAKARESAILLGLGNLLDRRATSLSSGQMRRALVARALVHDPTMLLLDEPYSSLDIAARSIFTDRVRALARRGHAIVLVTHELSEIAPEIERVVMIKEGRIVADGDKAELLKSELVSELFGLPLKIVEEAGLYRAIPR